MGKVVLSRQKFYLLRVVHKIPLILKVDPVRGIQVKENQEANQSPSRRRTSSLIIVKSMGIINLSV
jgi:hypothetical protein